MRNFGVNDLHRFRRFVSVPMLPAAINDAASPAFEDGSGPGVRGQAEPAALLCRGGLWNDQISATILITAEILFSRCNRFIQMIIKMFHDVYKCNKSQCPKSKLGRFSDRSFASGFQTQVSKNRKLIA